MDVYGARIMTGFVFGSSANIDDAIVRFVLLRKDELKR